MAHFAVKLQVIDRYMMTQDTPDMNMTDGLEHFDDSKWPRLRMTTL